MKAKALSAGLLLLLLAVPAMAGASSLAQELEEGRARLAALQNLAQAQQRQLQKGGAECPLQQLETKGQEQYLAAQLKADMTRRQEEEKFILGRREYQLRQEAVNLQQQRRRQVASQYALEVFNLRLKLDNLRLAPTEREQLQQQLQTVEEARAKELAALDAELKSYVDARLDPQRVASTQKLQDEQQQLAAKNAAVLQQAQRQPELQPLAAALQATQAAIAQQEAQNARLLKWLQEEEKKS